MNAPDERVGSLRPVLMGLLVRSREYRRPSLWAGVRVACGTFNLLLGALLLALAEQIGSLAWLAVIPLAGAALIFWTAHELETTDPSRPFTS